MRRRARKSSSTYLARTYRGSPLPKPCKNLLDSSTVPYVIPAKTVAHKVLSALTAVWSAARATQHDGVCALRYECLDHSARRAMLWTLFVVLLVLWFLGVVSSYTLGGFIHLLLVLALIAVVLQLVAGRRVV